MSGAEFSVALLQIIGINIVLSGDNAVVIALACRGLPPAHQSRAIAWGSGAAVAMRIVLTIAAVELLRLPWLKLLGAILLLWIAVKLLVPSHESGGHGKESANLGAAIRTILLADLVMSVDNVIAVAAAAKGSTTLLILGLAISIPIVVFASRMLLTLMERLPVIITLGAALLGWVAGEMAIGDPMAETVVAAQAGVVREAVTAAVPYLQHYVVPALAAIAVVLFGRAWAARSARIAREARAGSGVAAVPGNLKRILLPVDGSAHAERAVRHALALGRNLRAPRKLDVQLINVQRPVSGDVQSFVSGKTLDSYYGERSEQALAPARAILAEAGMKAREHRRVGDPGHWIAETAQKEGCDLIVMGARGLATHTGALLGSVARSTVENAGVPVLLVK